MQFLIFGNRGGEAHEATRCAVPIGSPVRRCSPKTCEGKSLNNDITALLLKPVPEQALGTSGPKSELHATPRMTHIQSGHSGHSGLTCRCVRSESPLPNLTSTLRLMLARAVSGKKGARGVGWEGVGGFRPVGVMKRRKRRSQGLNYT